jgi:hypothetical protein
MPIATIFVHAQSIVPGQYLSQRGCLRPVHHRTRYGGAPSAAIAFLAWF